MTKLLNWPFFILSIFLSSLTIVSIMVNGYGIELFAMPKKIYLSYREFIDQIFYYLFEWFLPFKIDIEVKDAAAFWVLCSITLYKYYKIRGGSEYVWEHWRRVLFAPLMFVLAALVVFSKDFRSTRADGLGEQHFWFYAYQLLILFIYGVLATLFFWWNYTVITHLPAVN